MKYLGIDYGKNKVGLSLSEGEIAAPFKNLEIGGLKDGLAKVIKIIEDEDIEMVVIGLAESGESRTMTKKFISELKKRVQVIEVDETLTTQRAKEAMIEMGGSQKSRQKDDAYSAALILQNYLDNL